MTLNRSPLHCRYGDQTSCTGRSSPILLFGGDKTGEWNDWYEWAAPLADDLYGRYLDELRNGGLI